MTDSAPHGKVSISVGDFDLDNPGFEIALELVTGTATVNAEIDAIQDQFGVSCDKAAVLVVESENPSALETLASTYVPMVDMVAGSLPPPFSEGVGSHCINVSSVGGAAVARVEIPSAIFDMGYGMAMGTVPNLEKTLQSEGHFKVSFKAKETPAEFFDAKHYSLPEAFSKGCQFTLDSKAMVKKAGETFDFINNTAFGGQFPPLKVLKHLVPVFKGMNFDLKLGSLADLDPKIQGKIAGHPSRREIAQILKELGTKEEIAPILEQLRELDTPITFHIAVRDLVHIKLKFGAQKLLRTFIDHKAEFAAIDPWNLPEVQF